MKPKVLIVSPESTHPTTGGNRNCILKYSELLKSLGYEVSFLYVKSFFAPNEEYKLTKEYWGDRLFMFETTIFFALKKKLLTYWKFSFYRPSQKRNNIYNIDDWFPRGLGEHIKKIQKSKNFKYLIINYIWLSKIFDYVNECKKLLFTHDVFSHRAERTGSHWFSTDPVQESIALNRSDTVMSIQDEETHFLKCITSQKVITTYSPVEIFSTPYVGNKVLIFIGSGNLLNQNGINWFLDNVYNQLKHFIPELELFIAGGICKTFAKRKLPNGIQLLGEIKYLKDLYLLGDIFINPISSGTGLKIKTIEALSYGKVLITHEHNLVGLPILSGIPAFPAHDTDKYLELIRYYAGNENNIIDIKEKINKYMVDYNNLVKSRFLEALNYQY